MQYRLSVDRMLLFSYQHSHGGVRVISLESREELCTLYWFEDGAWAVVDRMGRYDGGDGQSTGEVPSLRWVRGTETIALDQLRDHYFDPHLLAKHLGRVGARPRRVAAVQEVKLAPKVEVVPPGRDGTLATIRLENRGGGIGRIQILVNGKTVQAYARGERVAPDQPAATLTYDLANDQNVMSGVRNTIQVIAFDRKGQIKTKGPLKAWVAPGRERTEPPDLWAIVCGVSDYEGDAIDLAYAAADAEQFAKALTLAGERYAGYGRVDVSVLSTSGTVGTIRPSKDALREAFERARAAKPEDVLVVYLSGHGVSGKGEDDDFYFLLPSAPHADFADPAMTEQARLSSEELFGWIQEIPAATRQVLVLDTCAAGRLVQRLTDARDVGGNQEREIQRLKEGLGLFILAGCAADRVSYEASRYGQGLLTYSLLRGMKLGEALADGHRVEVLPLFEHAQRLVPSLAREVGGAQQPIFAIPRGGVSFPIGALSDADRENIKLQPPRPFLVRASFQDDALDYDVLDLTPAVQIALRKAVARGGTAAFVFIDVDRAPDAYRLAGSYDQADDEVTVRAKLIRGRSVVDRFEESGSSRDVHALARKVVERSERAVREEETRRAAKTPAGAR